MQTRSQTSQPAQPPKEAAYVQSTNPISRTPQEQRAPAEPTRHHGDSIAAISRTAKSNPASDEVRAKLNKQHRQHELELHNAPDVDLEYGVEQQPSEGYIAETVQHKGMGIQRAQAGAHSGPVGSAGGPGHSGFGEQDDLMANMDQKQSEHHKLLGEKIGHSPAPPDEEVDEGENVRRQLDQGPHLDVKSAVHEATGDPVVGN